ncbi:MAG TPA: energy transducer TonB [Gammaproteobacteria bacterium]
MVTNAYKTPAVIILSLAINFLLFLLIYHLVTNEVVKLPKFESLSNIEFIDIQKKKDTSRELPEEQEPEELEEPEAPPELPTEPVSEIPDTPQPDLPAPSPNIDIPLGVDGVPYIGDFMKSAPADVGPELPVIDSNVVPTRRIEPIYPPRAQRAGIEGYVVVEFTIDIEGKVKDIKVVESEPEGMFERAVRQALQKWEFPPKISNGKAVEQRARQEIRFSLQGR